NYGALIEIPDGRSGMIHMSELVDTCVKDVRDDGKEQENVKVTVLGLHERGKLDRCVKQALSPEERVARVRAKTSFEDKLKAFLKESEERLLDLKRNTEAKRGGGKKRK